jgi:ubiquinone/menaquinone biosynthesis C-methylase UbiE
MMYGGGQEVPMIARSRSRRIALLSLAFLVAGMAPALGRPSERARLVEALDLREGMHVADVGAGDGEWSERLAQEVGVAGHVYATEIDAADVETIEERARRAGLENVTVILGTETDTRLPDGCCEAILLRMVYHHFTDPAPMRASLRRALRPGARLAVVDLQPRGSSREPPGVPDRGGHGIRMDELVDEMTSDGFEVVARYDDWNGSGDRYCVIFRRADGPRASGGAR